MINFSLQNLMGNLLFGDYIEEDNLSIQIKLQKSCYYPGETLNGTIILQAKTNKISSVFNFTNAVISIAQYQQYKFYLENILLSKDERNILSSNSINFKKYKNRSILIPLSLPFNIKIPRETDPSFIHDETNFIRHFLIIKFPSIKCKNSIGIIIQNRQNLLKENGLFKEAVEKFNDVRKADLLRKYSKIAYLFRTDKNSYAYNEIIPYEIIMNCTECDIDISYLRVSLKRIIYFGANDKIESKIIMLKNYKISERSKRKIFKIAGHFLFPVLSDYFSVNPMNIYNYFNKRTLEDSDKIFQNIFLFPTCFSSLFICNYCLEFEIIFNSIFVKNEILSIPIELYTPLKIIEVDDKKCFNKNTDDEMNKNLTPNEETPNGDDDNFINNIINDDNLININDPDLNSNDFEIINVEDFYKTLSDEKENKLIS